MSRSDGHGLGKVTAGAEGLLSLCLLTFLVSFSCLEIPSDLFLSLSPRSYWEKAEQEHRVMGGVGIARHGSIASFGMFLLLSGHC